MSNAGIALCVSNKKWKGAEGLTDVKGEEVDVWAGNVSHRVHALVAAIDPAPVGQACEAPGLSTVREVACNHNTIKIQHCCSY